MSSSAEPAQYLLGKRHVMDYADTIERAFQLARSGKFESVGQIQKQLSREGFDASRVAGPTLVAQLNKLINRRDDCWKAYLQAKAQANPSAEAAHGRRRSAPHLRLITSR